MKLHRCICKICGQEFWHKNSNRKKCEDKEAHAKIRLEVQIQREMRDVRERWGRVANRPNNSIAGEWSGSWDNAAKVNET